MLRDQLQQQSIQLQLQNQQIQHQQAVQARLEADLASVRRGRSPAPERDEARDFWRSYREEAAATFSTSAVPEVVTDDHVRRVADSSRRPRSRSVERQILGNLSGRCSHVLNDLVVEGAPGRGEHAGHSGQSSGGDLQRVSERSLFFSDLTNANMYFDPREHYASFQFYELSQRGDWHLSNVICTFRLPEDPHLSEIFHDRIQAFFRPLGAPTIRFDLYQSYNLLIIYDSAIFRSDEPLPRPYEDSRLGNCLMYEFTFSGEAGRETKVCIFDQLSLTEQHASLDRLQLVQCRQLLAQRSLEAANKLSGVRLVLGTLPFVLRTGDRLTPPLKQACYRTSSWRETSFGATFGAYLFDPHTVVTNHWFVDQSMYVTFVRGTSRKSAQPSAQTSRFEQPQYRAQPQYPPRAQLDYVRSQGSFVPKTNWSYMNVDNSLPLPIFLSVRVEANEVVLDPGATSAMGSDAAWQSLDAALHAELGYGFSTTVSSQQFRSANGHVDPGMRDFYLEIPLCRNGKWCLYQFRGTSVNCGTDPSAKTPILFPSRDTRVFGLIADFEDGTLQWRHLKGFGMRSRICESGHYAFNFVQFVKAAWQLYESKNGVGVRCPSRETKPLR